MRVDSNPERGPTTRALGRRLAAGVAAVVAAAVSAVLGTLAVFAFLVTPVACPGPDRWQDLVSSSVVVAFVMAFAVLGWTLTLSFLRMGWGRPGLRKRSWFALQAVGLVVTLVAIGIAVATAPGPDAARVSEDCGLSSLH